MKNTIIVDGIRIPVERDEKEALAIAEGKLKKLGIGYDKESVHIHKKSVDARRKNNISFVISVMCETSAEVGDVTVYPGIRVVKNDELTFGVGHEKMNGRPCIVGLGPAGIFCGLVLAANGFRPVIFERGSCVEQRVKKIDSFYKTGILDCETNIQFGAGGAGTFSDGKLVTRIGDARTAYVLKKFTELGAPSEIMWKAKPHIGTDILRKVIDNAAEEIIKLGGEIHYDTKVESVGDGYVTVLGEKLPFGAVIVAPGHSARDVYSSLIKDGFAVEAKPFSVGVRAEHLQSELDAAMYGDPELWHKLGHAEYQLSLRKGDRGVYTFCMCPGGQVVAAASESGGVVTNGMSNHARDGRNANAAVAVSVLPEDFSNNPIGAIEFQRKLERAAFVAGGSTYAAPCQSVGNFFDGKEGGFGSRICPTYMDSNVRGADFNKLF